MSHLAHSTLRARPRAGGVSLLAGLVLSLVAAGIVCAEPGLLDSPFLAPPLEETAQPLHSGFDSALLGDVLLENPLLDDDLAGDLDGDAIAVDSGMPGGGAKPLLMTPAAPVSAWIGDDWVWNLEDTGTVLPGPTTARPAEEAAAESLLRATWRIVGKPRVLVLVAAAAIAAAILLVVTVSRAI